jgi:hypothetical protein
MWALGTVGLHAGIAVTMGLWSFSAVMMVLTTAAFLAPDRPAEPTTAPAGNSEDQRAAAAPGPARVPVA